MEVIINVSPVVSCITAAHMVLCCSSVTFLPAHPSHLPSSPGDKLVISHQLCPGIRWPAHEDMADIPHLLQCCIAQESELRKRASCTRVRVVQESGLRKRVGCAREWVAQESELRRRVACNWSMAHHLSVLCPSFCLSVCLSITLEISERPVPHARCRGHCGLRCGGSHCVDKLLPLDVGEERI